MSISGPNKIDLTEVTCGKENNQKGSSPTQAKAGMPVQTAQDPASLQTHQDNIQPKGNMGENKNEESNRPPAPENLFVITNKDGRVVYGWDQSPGAMSYISFISDSAESTAQWHSRGGIRTTCYIWPAPPNTKVFLKVRAVNKDGDESPDSKVLEVTTEASANAEQEKQGTQNQAKQTEEREVSKAKGAEQQNKTVEEEATENNTGQVKRKPPGLPVDFKFPNSSKKPLNIIGAVILACIVLYLIVAFVYHMPPFSDRVVFAEAADESLLGSSSTPKTQVQPGSAVHVYNNFYGKEPGVVAQGVNHQQQPVRVSSVPTGYRPPAIDITRSVSSVIGEIVIEHEPPYIDIPPNGSVLLRLKPNRRVLMLEDPSFTYEIVGESGINPRTKKTWADAIRLKSIGQTSPVRVDLTFKDI